MNIFNLVIDSFGKILIPGLTITIPLTIIYFSIGLVVAYGYNRIVVIVDGGLAKMSDKYFGTDITIE